MKLSYTIKNNENFDNVKEVLKTRFEISDRLLLKLKNNNKIFLNNSSCGIKADVHSNDTIEVHLDFKEDNSNIVATKMQLNIIYEDDYLLILNKPAGIPIHPSMQHYEDSLSNGVKYYFDSINLNKKIRPVNRLDKDTSGIVIFAKNEYIQECLVKQMKQNVFKKKYLAVLSGILEKDSGTISAPIARKNNSIIEREIREDGDLAISHFKVLERFNNMTLVEYTLETGRTHQLRVHSKYIGHPIVGDSLYGSENSLISRQALHAYEVSFVHPINKEKMLIHSNLPDDIKKLVNANKT